MYGLGVILKRLLGLGGCLLFCACATERGAGGRVPAAALALEGPPLAVVGEYADYSLTGAMDRACMAGYGALTLTSGEQGLLCTANMDAPPGLKGRVRGVLLCNDGNEFEYILRNIGPDQGVGIAREAGQGAVMVFFYHASASEARRRFPGIKEDIAKVAAQKAKLDAESPSPSLVLEKP